jgi:hypothetical protein
MLPRRRPEPLELLSDIEFPLEEPELEEVDDVDDVDDVPPEDEDEPDEEDPEGTALPLETAPAGAVCCAFAAGATATAMMPVKLAARR